MLRLPPAADLVPVVQAAASLGDPLILCTVAAPTPRQVAGRLDRAGVPVALHPDDWAAAAAGGRAVVGTRAAAWAPVPDLAAVVVFDEHDEVHQEERSPTWHARDVAVERARRAGVPCVLVSPMPTLEALAAGRLVTVDRADRAGRLAAWSWWSTVATRTPAATRCSRPALADIVRCGRTGGVRAQPEGSGRAAGVRVRAATSPAASGATRPSTAPTATSWCAAAARADAAGGLRRVRRPRP